VSTTPLSTRRALLARAAARPAPDVAALRRLAEVEQLLVYVYGHVRAHGRLGARARAVVGTLAAHEQAHLAALARELRGRGGAVPAAPAGAASARRQLAGAGVRRTLAELRGENDAIELLVELEAAAERAYHRAIGSLSDPALVRLAAQQLSCEAQHTAALRLLVWHESVDRVVSSAFVTGRG
jgi:hypothetical protein